MTAADHDYQTDESYSYDATGNRTNTGYSTGDNNQLLSDGTYDYEYDEEGNRTKKTHSTTGDYVEYDWDHKNRLVAVSFRNSSDTLTKKVVYTYDVYDRLIRKQVDDDGDSTFDRAAAFVYDDDDVILVFDESSSLTHRYLHGADVDQVFADDSISEILWSLTDNQGTVRDVVNYDPVYDNSNVANHLEFDSFGNITAESDSNVEFRYSYTGRYLDVDTGNQYSRARWLDLENARFLSEDPIEDDINLTRYVHNDPANRTDPSGLADLKLNVNDAKSMPWHAYRATKKDEYAHTNPGYGVDSRPVYGKNKQGKIIGYKFRFRIRADIKINIDIAAIARMKRRIRGLTPATAYGHEQRHVNNTIAILKEVQKEVSKFEKQAFLYMGEKELQKRRELAMKAIMKRIKDLIEQDAKHLSKKPLSPKAGQLLPPIGQMPANPTPSPKKPVGS